MTATTSVTPSLQPMPELAPLLKQLRLSGFLESLPTRNREAVAHKLSYTEFLALLIQDEVARREHKKFNLRVRRAGFRSQKTLEAFDWGFNVHIDQAQIRDLATCRFIDEKVAVLIAGPCGTGKSHIAASGTRRPLHHSNPTPGTTPGRSCHADLRPSLPGPGASAFAHH